MGSRGNHNLVAVGECVFLQAVGWIGELKNPGSVFFAWHLGTSVSRPLEAQLFSGCDYVDNHELGAHRGTTNAAKRRWRLAGLSAASICRNL